METVADGLLNPTRARHAGRVVAFTVGLSALDTNRSIRKQEIQQEDLNFGGTTRVQVTVLRRVGAARHLRWKVTAQSSAFHVQPYLGHVVQIPLNRTLPVRAGDMIALTTPTWAPVLALNQDQKKFAYRQSRKSNCSKAPGASQAQETIGQKTVYGCKYPGTRVEYTATEVTTTPYPKNYVHAPDVPASTATAQPSVVDSPFRRASPLRISGGAGL
jgi:hypothetical protein